MMRAFLRGVLLALGLVTGGQAFAAGTIPLAARALWGLTFDLKCLHTNMEFVHDDRCPLSKNWTRMSRSNLSRKALVSADARARPIAHRTAVEAQIPTEVLRQDRSRSPCIMRVMPGKRRCRF